MRATETATDVSVLPREMSRSDRGVRGREALSVSPNTSCRRKKKRPWNTPRSLKNVRATETATDVSILPREMSRSDRGVRGREALSVSPELLPQATKKRPGNTPRPLNNVRAKGLEPIRTKAPDPKSGLATNYNTLANPFRKTHNMKPIAEYDLVGSCRILCPKRNAKIVKDFQFSKPVRIFVKNTEKNTIFVHRKDK